MQLTLTSFGSIIVFSYCFGIFLKIALKNNKLLSRVKYELLLFCLTAPIMRLVIPMEVLPWTHNINVPYILPDIVILVNKTLFTIGAWEISFWDIVLIGLFTASVILTLKMVIEYCYFLRLIRLNKKVEDPKIRGLVEKILKEKGKKKEIDLRWTVHFQSPCVVGIIKPTILIPEKEYAYEDLENVFRHEIAHYLSGDLVISFAWSVIKTFCFWNPAVYLLDKQLRKLMEIRADENAIGKKDMQFQDDYMQTIVNLIAKKPTVANKYGASFHEKDGLPVMQRLEIIMDRADRKFSSFVIVNIVTCLVVIGLTVAMNCLIFEPRSLEPKNKPADEEYATSTIVTDDNSFLIKNADGTYNMYYKGKYCVTLDDNRGTDLPIYESLEEAMGHEQDR